MWRKMRHKIVAGTLATLMVSTNLGGITYATTPELNYWIGDGLTRYYDTQAAPVEVGTEIRLQAARNEYETGQVVLKSNTQNFTITNVQMPTLTSGGNTIDAANLSYNFALYQVDILTNTAGQWGNHGQPLYPYSGIPDPLSNDATIEVESGKNQPIYIKTYIPEGTAPGTYTGNIVVETTIGNINVPIEVEVFGATVPSIKDAGFTYYNWMSDIIQGYYTEWNVFETYYKVEDVIRTESGPDFSSDFYEIVNNWAESMIDHRQNSVLIHTVGMLDAADTTVDANGTYTFDWTLFDKYVDIWLANGMTSIANIHFGYHEKDVMLVPDEKGNAVFAWQGYSKGHGLDKEKDNWYKQYLPALAAHIEAYDITKYPQFKGTGKETLFDIWGQQLYDEPTATDLWVYYAELTREYLVVKDQNGQVTKNVKIFDADMTGATKQKPYTDYTDIQVPQLKFIPGHEEAYSNLQDKGQEFWAYVCVSPGKPWLNRFVGQPDTTYPMLFWYEAQINATGYLHWAFNVWNIGYMDDGDCYMVYPDIANNDILSSIRYEGQRDGVEDWELFQLAKQTDATKTQDILNRAVVHPNGSYVQDIDDYRALRNAMLHLASGNADIEVPDVSVDGNVVAPEPPLGAYYIDNLNSDIRYTNMQAYHHNSDNESYRKSVHYENYTGPVGSYGGRAELDFKGTGIEIMSEQRSNKGDILVELERVLEDGTTESIEKVVVSCLSQNTKPFYVPYKKNGLEYGDYRISMTNIRTSNGSPATQMVLDAFMVHTLKEDGTSPIVRVDLLASEKGRLEVSSEGVVLESGDVVKIGKEVIITAIPNKGYYCKALNINGTQYPVTNNKYVIDAIDKNIIVAPVFEKIPGEVVPATNVALGKATTASSMDESNGYLASYLVDGNAAMDSKLAWSNDAKVNDYRTSDLWVQVALDEITAIDTVNMYWNNWGTTYVANQYEVQVSTTGIEEDFQTVASQTNHVSGKSEFVFDEIDAKYVRIWMPKNSNAAHNAVLLHEIEVISVEKLIPEEVDKVALQTLIKQVEAMDLSLYTDETVAVVREALNQAKQCYDNPYATTVEVENVINELNTAITALEEKVIIENVALGRPVTASSIDTSNGYSTEALVDGDVQTLGKPAWSNDATTNSIHTSDLWVEVELAKETLVDHVNLYWNNWMEMELAPKAYEIQVSATGEEGTYETVATQTTQIRGKAEHKFNPTNAKYIRVWIPQDGTLGHNAICVHEIEVMNAVDVSLDEKELLQALIAEVRAMNLEGYTPASRATLEKALAEAVACVDKVDATTEEIAEAFATLNRAKEALVTISEVPVFYTVGADKVNAGEEYQLGIGINAKAKDVYAQEIYVIYDPAVMEYDGHEMLNNTVEVLVDTEMTEGVIHIFTVTPSGGVSSDQILMNLNFEIKEDAKTSTKLKVEGAVGVIQAGEIVESKEEVLELKEHTIIINNNLRPDNAWDVNQDTTINVADLALIAYHYRKTSEDSEWDKIKHVDVNKDGIIDILDLVEVAMKIKEK